MRDPFVYQIVLLPESSVNTAERDCGSGRGKYGTTYTGFVDTAVLV